MAASTNSRALALSPVRTGSTTKDRIYNEMPLLMTPPPRVAGSSQDVLSGAHRRKLPVEHGYHFSEHLENTPGGNTQLIDAIDIHQGAAPSSRSTVACWMPSKAWKTPVS
jgi:hypothetical protein